VDTSSTSRSTPRSCTGAGFTTSRPPPAPSPSRWTFRGQRGHFAYQGLRFLVVSLVALAANLVCLRLLVAVGLDKVPAQAVAIVLVTPLNFVGNKLWSFRRR